MQLEMELTKPLPVSLVPAWTPVPLGIIRTCQWPIGHPGTREFRFCGDPIERGRPYCCDHARLAYVRRAA